MGFVHLHLHTEYSLLDGATKVNDLFDHVKSLGMDTVAITEHGNMHSVIAKYQQAKKAGVKLIFGVEAYVIDDHLEKDRTKKRYHLVLLAKNITGYKNLIRLVSIANTDGFYYKPRIDKKLLKQYSEGLICLSACLGNDIAQAVVNDDMQRARNLIQGYIDIFGKEDFYLEIENHSIPKEKVVREAYYRFADEFGLKLVATTDSHYLKKEHSRAHEIMLCIQTNSTIDNPNRFKFDGKNFHVTSEGEMRRLFQDRPDAIDNTVEIAEKCNVELELGHHIFPDFEAPKGKTHEEYLLELCKKALKETYGKAPNLEEAEERMIFELSVINKMEFATYFLIVWDFIKAAKEKCQVGPGRGSGAGSIVAYLLGITQLEPLSLGLLFERFLNPDRISLPDFDIDFGDRDVALDYVKHKYGEEKIALIGTFGTMSAKSVLKDVSRAFGIPFSISNEITKYVTEGTIKKSLDKKDEKTGAPANAELGIFKEKYPEVFDIALILEGCVRHRGIHACGAAWGKKAITEYLPVYAKDGQIVAQVDGNQVEDAGLVKFDFLGLETLNITKKTLDIIGKDDKWLENIPLDDPAVYEMLQKAESVGIFQVESPGMQKTLAFVKPTCFDDIIAILALYRPGAMDYIPDYAKRKDGKEKVVYPHPLARDILAPTYGILVYQEQVMQLSRVLAGFTMGESDVLRKAIGKKKLDLMMKMEEKFKDGCTKVACMDKKTIDNLWDNIVKFASYSFNKSHAAAYALISYRTAYLKKYYPIEFMSAVISSNTRDPEKMAFYLEETRSMDIEILPPEINFSDRSFIVEKGHKAKAIRFGLSGIKHVGEEAISEIMRKRPYVSYQDFINKVDISRINKRVLRSLISVGCFDNFKHNRVQLLEVYEKMSKEEKSSTKQMTLFGTEVKDTIIPEMGDMKMLKKLELEKEFIGVYISGHPIDMYAEAKFKPLLDYSRLRDDTETKIFGLVDDMRKIVTRNGDNMAFMTIYNKKEQCRVVVFPNVYEKCNLHRAIDEYQGVIIEGTYKEDSQYGGSLIAKEIRFSHMIPT